MWDGGDCCSATCEPGSGGDCIEGTFDCRDGTEEPSVSNILLTYTPRYLKPHGERVEDLTSSVSSTTTNVYPKVSQATRRARGGSDIACFVHNYSCAHTDLCAVHVGCLPTLGFSHIVRPDIGWVHI